MKGLGEILAQLIDKLAGKGTNLQLTFKDLTLEWAGMKTKLNGSLPRTAEFLQIPIGLIQTAKHGKISLQVNGVENIQLRIENNKIDLNFLEKETLKTLLELEGQIEKESILKKLRNLKDLAEELKQNGFTITLSHKGQVILTLGSEANPTISQMVTETSAIEVNNLVELLKLA